MPVRFRNLRPAELEVELAECEDDRPDCGATQLKKPKRRYRKRIDPKVRKPSGERPFRPHPQCRLGQLVAQISEAMKIPDTTQLMLSHVASNFLPSLEGNILEAESASDEIEEQDEWEDRQARLLDQG